MLQEILEIAKRIRCHYPKTINHEKLPPISYTNYQDIKDYSYNPNSIMDCGGVLYNILLQYYLDKSIDNIKFTRTIYNTINEYRDKIDLLFIKDRIHNSNLNLYYLENVDFYLLKNDYLDKGLIPLSTNNMGYWILSLGITKDIKSKVDEFWYGEQNLEKECFLAYYYQDNNCHKYKMIVCHIETIYNILILDSNKDWEYMIQQEKDHIRRDCYQNIYDIILEKNNSTKNSIKKHYMASLFPKNENTILNGIRFLDNIAYNISNSSKSNLSRTNV